MSAVRSMKQRIAVAIATSLAVASAAFAAVPAQAAPAEGVVLAANSAEAVPGSYLVTLKPGAGLTATGLPGKALISKYGGKVKRTFTSTLDGYSVTLSGTQARRLAADPQVASVEQDQVVHALGTQTSAPGAWTASTRRTCR